MRTHQVAIGDLITAINGLPVMGCDTRVIANVLQALPACVTLRLTKYGAQYLQKLLMRQVRRKGGTRKKGHVGVGGVQAVLAL